MPSFETLHGGALLGDVDCTQHLVTPCIETFASGHPLMSRFSTLTLLSFLFSSLETGLFSGRFTVRSFFRPSVRNSVRCRKLLARATHAQSPCMPDSTHQPLGEDVIMLVSNRFQQYICNSTCAAK